MMSFPAFYQMQSHFRQSNKWVVNTIIVHWITYINTTTSKLPCERLFSCATDADQESVASVLADHPGDTRHMLHGVHEEHELHLLRRLHVIVVQVLETSLVINVIVVQVLETSLVMHVIVVQVLETSLVMHVIVVQVLETSLLHVIVVQVLETKGGEISKLYTCPQTTGCKKHLSVPRHYLPVQK